MADSPALPGTAAADAAAPAGAASRTHAGVIPSLDGIRAVAVLIVVAAHAGFGDVVPGGLGVTIFFFLSGYLITTLLLSEHQRSGTIHIPWFFLRRFLRLAPPLVVSLLLAYGLALAGFLGGGIGLQGFLAQLFYFANYYVISFGGQVPDGTGILWSLAVEEHFYILFPFVMSLMLARLRLAVAAQVFMVVCLVVLAWRFALVVGFGVPEERTYYATDTRIDSILFGSIFAIWSKRNPGAGGDAREWIPTAAFGAGLLLILASLLYREPVFRETWRYSLQGLALMPIFHYLIHCRGSLAFRALNASAVRRIGVYSYSIYLIHYVIVYLIPFHASTRMIDRLLLFAITLCLSIAYAFLIDRYVDGRFKSVRARYH